MADLESVATLPAKQEITKILRTAFNEGVIGNKDRKITKSKQRHHPRNLIYQPIPGPVRYAFGETIEQMHNLRESLIYNYMRARAWVYSNVPCIYF